MEALLWTVRRGVKSVCSFYFVLLSLKVAYTVQTIKQRFVQLREYIEERATAVAVYIIESGATVRQTAKKFGVSKSTVHMVVTI